MILSLSSCILLITNASLTFLSIYWSVTAWVAYHAARAEQPWTLTNCTVISKAAKNRSYSYCPILVVANFSDPPPEPTEAYRHGFDIYNESKASAEEFLKKYTINETYECWISPPPDVSLSLTPVPYGPDAHDVNLAAISTVLALAAGASFAAVTYLLLVTSPTVTIDDFVTQPSIATTSGLSPRAIEAILAAAKAADAECPTAQEDMCAVCLDSGLGAKLTCGHRFHPGCIHAWLSRGGETCPLCCALIHPPLSRTPTGYPSMIPREICHDSPDRFNPRGRTVQNGLRQVVRIASVEGIIRQGRHSAPANLHFNPNSDDIVVPHTQPEQPRSLRLLWNSLMGLRRLDSRDVSSAAVRAVQSAAPRFGRSAPRLVENPAAITTFSADNVGEDGGTEDVLHVIDLSEGSLVEVVETNVSTDNDGIAHDMRVESELMECLRRVDSQPSKES